MRQFGKTLAGLMLVVACAFAAPASAHKVIVSAYADGADIEGEIGFSNGDMAIETDVDILDDDGNILASTKTDDDGIFRYTPTKRIPLTFRANLGAGHVATYHMGLDELPEGIGGDERSAAAADAVNDVVAQMAPTNVGTPEGSASSVAVGLDPAMLQKLIAAEVGQQLEAFKPEIATQMRNEIKPLRKVVSEYMEKNDLQAILGGIGYICGLFGIGFYVAAVRDRKKHVGQEKEAA
ncbi:cobalt ABC transporter permease [Cohaesibacter haloalkalitolerans]|uniref:cobalt ABC transporter permease n=1 Tax=Cohaesibacter haloalkalitolerans TaxID=1162980 RepID=UPI001968B43E|nr:cobalt ABC transporter permease [Cohaesibacter haloalkalitolerans]